MTTPAAIRQADIERAIRAGKQTRRVERWKLAQTAMNKVNLHRSA